MEAEKQRPSSFLRWSIRPGKEKDRKGNYIFSDYEAVEDSLGMFDGPVHGAEEGPTVLYHAVEMDFVKEVTLCLTEVVCAKPRRRRIMNKVN